MLPGRGEPLSFDAENGLPQLAGVFALVEVHRWDEPMVEIPDREALRLFLRGRGLSWRLAGEAAQHFGTPLRVTKRGTLAWLRKP
ncbi:hypothetical protein A8924_4461 [Saccharopolyspora erythraea NRRL 2338]|uniref:Uncharacterized protein n=2 Tax=Saccharopolyspora erythraea TaxID=1836 RepID=A4FH17_SACEN|nr:hypothetical protein [Saccharopolyspora erythraea]EQD82578.1 hypothetical protein N599_29950 [Saccharopolyspora erythraea D]PFG97045.1 hypothetical protein A8924_4461 [Saccharopolyspora erythraea NRRL 2338]QRK87251.1 hypothetical protein JQX30_20690 [Saccharopolyspora erythraea]CAM03342.1 hypothetical protein SACE_4071 [Saccharopolyspora erythraea NRRL 2338]